MKGPEERNARIRFAQTVEKQRLYLVECQRQLDAIVAKDYEACLNEAAHANVNYGRCQHQQSSLIMPINVSLDTDYRAEAENHFLLIIDIKT